MNIVYISWNCFGQDDLFNALRELSGQVAVLPLTEKAKSKYDDIMDNRTYDAIKQNNAGLVVSFNYYPTVSAACMRAGCPYFSWIYDSPYVKMYDKSITNNVNYIGCFDSLTVSELNKAGVSTVHYLPLAVNPFRLQRQIAAAEKDSAFRPLIDTCADIAFVGSLYNDKNRFMERLFSKTHDMELIGYLDAVIDAQRKIYGCYFLDEALSGGVLAKIRNAMPYDTSEGSYITEKRIYADYYLGPRITHLERCELLERAALAGTVNLYTNSPAPIKGISIKPSVDYYTEMPVVFHRTRINLNCTLRSIQSGMPLRALDIMGAGGFLLTNYQEDFFTHFECGVHFECFTSMEEAFDKLCYYLSHDDKRAAVAGNALTAVQDGHTYPARLKKVFKELSLQ